LCNGYIPKFEEFNLNVILYNGYIPKFEEFNLNVIFCNDYIPKFEEFNEFASDKTENIHSELSSI
jgi:hypothetical protein